ncbi:MAG: BBP7 family outer membrane beta-barrel protein [Gemmataceae bacterium]
MKWRMWALTAALILAQSARGQDTQIVEIIPTSGEVGATLPKTTPARSDYLSAGSAPARRTAAAGPVSSALPDAGGCCGGCGQCAQSGCDEPSWEIRAGWLYLHRSHPDHQTLLNSPGRTPVADASNARFDWESGWELALEGRLDDCTDLELRYLQVDNFHASAGLGLAGNRVTGNIPTNPLTPFTSVLGPSFLFDYNSELRSGEINFWRRASDCTRVGLGFRWLQLNERLAISGAFPAVGAATTRNQINFNTRNNLWGLQFGLDRAFVHTCRFEVNGIGKAGIYWNDAHSDADLQQPIGTLIGNANDSVGRIAFVGELGVIASYRLTCNLSIYGGYEALWLEGVALASDQAPTTGSLLAPTTAATTTNGGVFMHGAVLGVKVSW